METLLILVPDHWPVTVLCVEQTISSFLYRYNESWNHITKLSEGLSKTEQRLLQKVNFGTIRLPWLILTTLMPLPSFIQFLLRTQENIPYNSKINRKMSQLTSYIIFFKTNSSVHSPQSWIAAMCCVLGHWFRRWSEEKHYYWQSWMLKCILRNS